jgi:recombination protein RecA
MSEALKLALQQIEKEFGKGAIQYFSDKPDMEVEVISTGNLSIDNITGVGGIPRRRITEIFGPLSCGKSTLALHLIKEAQKNGGQVAYIDTEHALDPDYAVALGVELDTMLISQPNTAEQGLTIVDRLCMSGEVALIIFDSVAAMLPEAEDEREMNEQQQGLVARLMGKAMRKLTPSVSRGNVALVFINQVREKIGVTYGDPTTTPGGKALGHHSSLRLDVRRLNQIKSGDDIVGHRVKITAVKNKLSPPYKKCEVDLLYGEGFCKYSDIIDQAIENKVITKSASWLRLGDRQLGQGKENVRQLLKEDGQLFEEITLSVLEKMAVAK